MRDRVLTIGGVLIALCAGLALMAAMGVFAKPESHQFSVGDRVVLTSKAGTAEVYRSEESSGREGLVTTLYSSQRNVFTVLKVGPERCKIRCYEEYEDASREIVGWVDRTRLSKEETN